MVAIFKQGLKVPYFLSLREIFVFHGLLLFSQHRNIRQAKGTLICRVTQIHSLMQAFSLSLHTSFLLWKIHIFISIKKGQEKPTVDSKRKVWEWGKTTRFKFWKKLLSTTEIRCSCFNEMHLNFNMIKAFKWVSPRGNIHLRLYDNINMYFCLDKCFWGSFVLVITDSENFDVSWDLEKVNLLEPIEIFVSPLILPLNTAQATSTISFMSKAI